MKLSLRWVGPYLLAALTENLGLKLLSLAVAIGLYVYSHGTQDAQRTIAVDVVAIPPPDSARRVLLTPLPPQLRVTVRGTRAALDELRGDDLGSVQVDLRDGKTDRVEFYPSMVHVPPGVRVEQIDPPSIELRWEDVIVRELPVQVSIVGQPAPGLVIKGPPKVEPAVVQARGPRSIVEVLQFARADAFDVNGIQREGVYERALAIDRPPTRVEFEPLTVVARVEASREEMQRLFVKLPVQLVGVARGSVIPPEVDVRVECPPELARSLRSEQIVPTVDLKAAEVNLNVAGSAKVEVQVLLDQCKATVQPHLVVARWQASG